MLQKSLAEVPPEIEIVVISKTVPVEAVLAAYKWHRVFGENRPRELINKLCLSETLLRLK